MALAEYVRIKSGLWQWWMYDVAERARIRRKSLAREAGLDSSWDVGPTFPGSTTVIQRGGGFASYALAAILGGGLLALGAYAASMYGVREAQTQTHVERITDIEAYRIEPRVIPPAADPE